MATEKHTPVIRTARKAHLCVNFRAYKAGNAPKCRQIINKGDRYEQGDVDPYAAGGFGHEFICSGCSEAVQNETGEHVTGKNCHVCAQDHGTAHYFAVCLPRHQRTRATGAAQ